MPIWSFTQERLDRLKEQMAKRKAEHDDLEAKSPKDLWCQDLDDFEVEWENQLRLDAEITTTIRRMGRRESKKIGAGRGRKAKDDDDYEIPAAKARAKTTVAKPKAVEQKTHQKFMEKFVSKPKKNLDGADEDSDGFSSDDYAALKSKPAKKAVAPAAPAAPEPLAAAEDSEVSDGPAPANTRVKRAAAAKPKAWIVDDDGDDESASSDDDDKMLGDVGALVKGIPGTSGDSGDNKTGRLSLFAMSRPESSHGNATALRVKSKPSKTFDFDSHDDTNYEMLARSSPHKSVTRNEVGSFSSDEDLPVISKVVSKAVPTKLKSSTSSEEARPSASSITGPAVKKARGRPAGAKAKAEAPAAKKKTVAAASKPVELSPAAKLYAKKKEAEKTKPKKDVFDMDDDDEDVEMEDPDSPPPRPAARGRPGRAAAVKKKPVYTIDDDEDDDDDDDLQLDDEADGGQDDESDIFAMDDSE
jgi:DNA topoisomerase-2